MLTVCPDLTCDICLECYTEAAGMPHAIPCGHIFCRGCLNRMYLESQEDSLIAPRCPICHREFSLSDIHQLHVDSGSPSPTKAALSVESPLQRLLDGIEKI
ncbi:hypothetical protein EV363DRAFT_1079193, partial [Boletus edulis]